MSSPQENTKIEQLTEAFESLAVTIAQGVVIAEALHGAVGRMTPEMVAVMRADARNEFADALRAFLKPSLRVIERKETYEREKAQWPGGIDDLKIG